MKILFVLPLIICLALLAAWTLPVRWVLKKIGKILAKHWPLGGVPSGPYLVLPLLGPSTLRDALTDNDFANIDASRKIRNSKERNLFRTVEAVNSRAAILTAESVVNDIALDRYSFIRDAFLQRRRNAIYDGDPPELPPESEKVEKTSSAAPSASKVEEAPAVPLEEKK